MQVAVRLGKKSFIVFVPVHGQDVRVLLPDPRYLKLKNHFHQHKMNHKIILTEQRSMLKAEVVALKTRWTFDQIYLL